MAPKKQYPKSVRRRNAYRSVARQYADAAASQPPAYWNDAVDVEWGCQDKYEVLGQVRDEEGEREVL